MVDHAYRLPKHVILTSMIPTEKKTVAVHFRTKNVSGNFDSVYVVY